jgi:hypothetical protein
MMARCNGLRVQKGAVMVAKVMVAKVMVTPEGHGCGGQCFGRGSGDTGLGLSDSLHSSSYSELLIPTIPENCPAIPLS